MSQVDRTPGSDPTMATAGEYEAHIRPRIAQLEAEVDRLREALERAHEQLSKHDYKGSKQIGRAMLTIERALGIVPDA